MRPNGTMCELIMNCVTERKPFNARIKSIWICLSFIWFHKRKLSFEYTLILVNSFLPRSWKEKPVGVTSLKLHPLSFIFGSKYLRNHSLPVQWRLYICRHDVVFNKMRQVCWYIAYQKSCATSSLVNCSDQRSVRIRHLEIRRRYALAK